MVRGPGWERCFLTAFECGIHDAYKQKVIGAKDSDTIVTGRPSGHPVRQLKNRFARDVRKMEGDSDASVDEIEQMLAGSLHRAVTGDVEMGSLMSGQVACLVHDEKPAAQVCRRSYERSVYLVRQEPYRYGCKKCRTRLERGVKHGSFIVLWSGSSEASHG